MTTQRMRPFRYKNKLLYFKGGGSTNSVDYAYNARMASIAETQSEWASQYNQFWVNYEQPFEKAKLAENIKMIPGETALSMEKTAAESALLPMQTDTSKAEMQMTQAGIKSAMGLMPYQEEAAKESLISSAEKDRAKRPVTEKYFKEAGEGVDVEGWANDAQADAAQAFLSSSSGVEMAMARRGAAPGSGAYSGKNNESAMSRTMMTGAARTSGRKSGERENFQRLKGAMGA